MNLIAERMGDRPQTTATNPHKQINQHPPLEIIEHLNSYILSLDNIEPGPTHIGEFGTRGFFLATCDHAGFGKGFIIDNEFIHIHPLPDGSMHLALPEPVGEQMISLKWGEHHPLAGKHGIPKTIYMLYAPRDDNELSVAKQFISASYLFAQISCNS